MWDWSIGTGDEDNNYNQSWRNLCEFLWSRKAYMFLTYSDLISKLQVSNRLAQDVPDMAVAAERLLGSPTQRFSFAALFQNLREVFGSSHGFLYHQSHQCIVCLASPAAGDARSVVSELEAAVNAKPGAHHVWNDPSVRVVKGFGFVAKLPRLPTGRGFLKGGEFSPQTNKKREGKEMWWGSLTWEWTLFRKVRVFFVASSLLGSQTVGSLKSPCRSSCTSTSQGLAGTGPAKWCRGQTYPTAKETSCRELFLVVLISQKCSDGTIQLWVW